MRWIYCHPLFDERKFSHRFSYLLSQAFDEQGHRLERFDYAGTGDNRGDFSEVTLESLGSDLANRFGHETPLNLIGLRIGATVAINTRNKFPDRVNKLIAIEPVLNGKKYVDHLFRKQRIKDMMSGVVPSEELSYTNIEGFKTHPLLIQQLQNINLSDQDDAINHLTPFWERISKIDYQPILQKVLHYVHH